MPLVRSSWQPLPLVMEKLSSQQPGIAEIAARLGANTNMHAGHAVGGDLLAGEANPAPVNPSGDYGHDHSGGDFGRPLFRSLATIGLGAGGSNDTANMLLGTAAVRHEHESVGASVDTRVGGPPVRLWCPPCDSQQDVGAYAAISVAARVEIESTNLISGDVLFLRVLQATPGFGGVEVDVPLSSGSILSTGWIRMQSTSLTRLPMAVGRLNTLQLSTVIERTGSGSARSATVRVDAVELGVYST